MITEPVVAAMQVHQVDSILFAVRKNAKRQKKTSCVSNGRPVPVLCTRKVAHHTSFLSRQSDVIASFFVWRVYCADVFSTFPEFLKEKVCIMTDFNLIWEFLV